eukprot:2673474-Alexandrium_andersonii.AAC.1
MLLAVLNPWLRLCLLVPIVPRHRAASADSAPLATTPRPAQAAAPRLAAALRPPPPASLRK